MALQDLHRPTVGSETAETVQLLSLVLEEQRACRIALERLVAVEDERRAGEVFLEAALKADAGDAGPVDLETLDFVRTPERKFLVREGGVLREPTPAEAAALAGTVNGANRRDSRRH